MARLHPISLVLVAALCSTALSGCVGCGNSDPIESYDDAEAGAGRESPERALVPASTSDDVAPQANSAPRILSVAFDPPNPTGDSVVLVVSDVVDPDDDSLFYAYQWSLAGKPIGEGTRRLSLSGASRGSLLSVDVTVSDGIASSSPVRAEVRLANRAPLIHRLSVFPSTNLVAGTNVTATPEARDPDGDPVSFVYEWRVNGELVWEEGAVFSTDDLKRGDALSVAVTATDGESQSEPVATPELRIANSPPRIVSIPSLPPTDGVFRYRVDAEDPDGDRDLQFHLEDAPEGMEIDSRSGDITWTPQPDQVGSRMVSVVVDDLRGGRSMQRFEVTVRGE